MPGSLLGTDTGRLGFNQALWNPRHAAFADPESDQQWGLRQGSEHAQKDAILQNIDLV